MMKILINTGIKTNLFLYSEIKTMSTGILNQEKAPSYDQILARLYVQILSLSL